MRSAQMVPGLNNRQVIRFVVDGFAMYCTVQGVHNIGTTRHRKAVWATLERLGVDRAFAKQRRQDIPTGLAWRVDVRDERNQLVSMDVQVDICDSNTVVF